MLHPNMKVNKCLTILCRTFIDQNVAIFQNHREFNTCIIITK